MFCLSSSASGSQRAEGPAAAVARRSGQQRVDLDPACRRDPGTTALTWAVECSAARTGSAGSSRGHRDGRASRPPRCFHEIRPPTRLRGIFGEREGCSSSAASSLMASASLSSSSTIWRPSMCAARILSATTGLNRISIRVGGSRRPCCWAAPARSGRRSIAIAGSRRCDSQTIFLTGTSLANR